MLEGSFELSFTARSHESLPSFVTVEPAGESHANRMGRMGARVLVVQPDPYDDHLIRACGALLGSLACLRSASIERLAWSVAGEMTRADGVADLAIEGLAFELLAAAARLQSPDQIEKRPPRWLRRVEESLRARFLENIHLAELAGVAGVHQVHLARVFRHHHGMSPGAFVRELRVEWAAGRLVRSDEPLADIAREAGYADQSHFTRAFRARMGISPGRFRRAHRS
ncbi:MAG TPA: AraC family transcriptional regulator [Candidatus Polarisedimenticolia bacterium]|nr:AraC family transcriptional regulator [Candidatus Polarisedimenticolia bacterium]